MPTNSQRWPLTKHLAELFSLRPGAGTVSVLDFPPGEIDITDEMLVATEIESEFSIPNSKAGRLERDETITIEWTVMVNGVREPGDCMTRFDEIVAFVDDTFADDASLGGFPGVLEARVTASKGKPARAQDGFYVLGTVTTVIETRLH